jgi:uncharacterized membrane protein HdeD (DUF308 family)
MALLFPAVPAAPAHDERASLRPVWWLFLALGLVLIVVGLLAISSVVIATMASVMVFGVLLLVAGASEAAHAVLVRNWRGFALHLVAATLYLIAGVFLLEDPAHGAVILTLLFAAALLVGGVLRIIFALAGQFPTWEWVVLNGVIDLVLGALIWAGWPESSLWVIGLFVGIDLVLHGMSCVMLALAVRSHNPAPTGAQGAGGSAAQT